MGGSGWARLGKYFPYLEPVADIGVLVFDHNIGRFGVRNWDGVDNFEPDVIVMQRIMFSDVPENMLIAKSNGQRFINDLDDWYWGLSYTNKAFAASHPKISALENVNHYKKILRHSDLVTVSTPYLAERIKGWVDCPVIVVPNTVDVERFTPREHDESTVPLVGWVGSTAHRSNDLQQLRGIVGPMVESSKIRLHHSGHHSTHPLLADEIGTTEDKVTVLPMVAPSEYPSLFVFDAGIVPLSDIPFNKAKSAIKGLEYAAAGLPFVASDLDSYRQLSDEGIGIIASKPRNWISNLSLLRDPEARKEIGAINRERVKAYDISRGVANWNEIFAGMLS